MLLHSSSFAPFVCTLPCLSHIPLLPPVFAILCLEATNFQMLLMVSQEKECTFSCGSVCVCNGVLCLAAVCICGLMSQITQSVFIMMSDHGIEE